SIVCGNQWHARPPRKLDQRFANSLLRIKAMLLNLQEVVPLPHDLFKFNGRGRSLVAVLARQGRRWHARQASGESDESLRMFSQKFLVDARFVIEAFGISLRGEAHQITITVQVFREQDQ